MTRKAGQRRQKPRLYKRPVTSPEVFDLVAQVMPVAAGAEPSGAHAWFDGRGRPRRIKVQYPNGWTVTVGIGVDGKVTTRSATLKLIAAAVPATAQEQAST